MAVENVGSLLANHRIRPMMFDRIREAQDRDVYLAKVREGVIQGKGFQK